MKPSSPKSVYRCSECSAEYSKWQGQCPHCNAWNTIEEQTVRDTSRPRSLASVLDTPDTYEAAVPLAQVALAGDERIDLHDEEFNRVLGGGLVRGSLTLLGGEPGIGKSTLLLQTVLNCTHIKTFYASGEESARQLRMRAERLGLTDANCSVICETDLAVVLESAIQATPDLLVIDSIQTMQTNLSESAPGSVSQVKECANVLLKFAKTLQIPVLIVGHINKEGSIAGPKVLEHIVDTVLHFEGDKQHLYRLLRSLKNRFGSTAEMGIYEMNADGLRPVSNPSEHLISSDREGLSGVAVSVAMEGVRPILIETQALVSSAIYSNPQRSATGVDLRRMNMLLAVLEKRAGFKLVQKDVFLNITGGLRVNDPAVDLAVICAILSSNLDISIHSSICFAGEVGLAGEVRAVSRIEQRIKEAERVGFKGIVVPKANFDSIDSSNYQITIHPCSRVSDLFRTLFAN